MTLQQDSFITRMKQVVFMLELLDVCKLNLAVDSMWVLYVCVYVHISPFSLCLDIYNVFLSDEWLSCSEQNLCKQK